MGGIGEASGGGVGGRNKSWSSVHFDLVSLTVRLASLLLRSSFRVVVSICGVFEDPLMAGTPVINR